MAENVDPTIDTENLAARVLPKETALKAEKELNERVKDKADAIQKFRETVSSQSDLKSRTDDNFLLRFLRARKYDQARALQLLRNYYKQRKKYPELFKDLQASSMSHVLTEPNMGALFDRDQEGRTVFVLNTASLWDPAVVTVDDCIRYGLLSFERILQDEDSQINGIVFCLDCRGFGLKHLAVHTPHNMMKLYSVFINSFPFRFKGVYAIHTPLFFKLAFSILKPFLTKKIKRRFIMNGDDLEQFHQRLSPEILPQEFGGKLGPFSNAGWNQELLKNDGVMKWNLQFGFLSADSVQT